MSTEITYRKSLGNLIAFDGQSLIAVIEQGYVYDPHAKKAKYGFVVRACTGYKPEYLPVLQAKATAMNIAKRLTE